MPFSDITKTFTRIWSFVDEFTAVETADRADFDVAFNDVSTGINDAIDYLESEIAIIQAQATLFLGLKASLPTLNNLGGPLVSGNTCIISSTLLQHTYNGADWVASGGTHGGTAVGLGIFRAADAPTARSILELGTAALLNFNPSLVSSEMKFADSVKAVFGTDSDMQMYHDNANGYLKQIGTGGLRIWSSLFSVFNKAGTETLLTATEDGAVALYFDNAIKFQTTLLGVTATGSMSATTIAGNWIATKLESEAGEVVDKVMTPERTREAIFAQAAPIWKESALTATTSGTAINITGLSALTEVELIFDEMSLNNTSPLLVQIGTGAAPVTAGYKAGSGTFGTGTATRTYATTGFPLFSNDAAYEFCGIMRFRRITGNVWVQSHEVFVDTATGIGVVGGGRVSLSGAFNNIRITTSAGTATFDGGQIKARYR